MYGISLEKKISFFHASERNFRKGEKHIDRVGPCDVLLLVYDGVLKFNIDGEDVEVHSGEYYIQRRGTVQKNHKTSLCPKYFFVHFNAKWDDNKKCLPYKGNFSYTELEKYLKNMNSYFGTNISYVEQVNSFFTILLNLYNNTRDNQELLATRVMNYLKDNYLTLTSLDELCTIFYFSKNYIINTFKKEYKITPIQYIIELKIKKAIFLLEASSLSISDISLECGFNNYSHFYRKFIKQTGKSPEQWRKDAYKNEYSSDIF